MPVNCVSIHRRIVKPGIASLIFVLLSNLNASAQQNRIKGTVAGIPLFQSGYIVGSIGYERLNKTKTASWQLHLTAGGGSIAADSRAEKRVWLTAERTFYLGNPDKKFQWFCSIFCEAGNRKKLSGHEDADSTGKRFVGNRQFEINPGTGLGAYWCITKKIGLEFIAGPKYIIANGEATYKNNPAITFTEPFYGSRFGFRGLFLFSYRF